MATPRHKDGNVTSIGRHIKHVQFNTMLLNFNVLQIILLIIFFYVSELPTEEGKLKKKSKQPTCKKKILEVQMYR